MLAMFYLYVNVCKIWPTFENATTYVLFMMVHFAKIKPMKSKWCMVYLLYTLHSNNQYSTVQCSAVQFSAVFHSGSSWQYVACYTDHSRPIHFKKSLQPIFLPSSDTIHTSTKTTVADSTEISGSSDIKLSKSFQVYRPVINDLPPANCAGIALM